MRLVFFWCARKSQTTQRLAGLTSNRLFRNFRFLKEKYVERLNQRSVQTIQPDNWIFRLVVMIVPSPVGRENQVALFHKKFFALDRRVGPLALHDEANRRHVVPVRLCHLARIYD